MTEQPKSHHPRLWATRIAAFLDRPWSIDRTLCVALAAGSALPFINSVLYRVLPFEAFWVAPWIFFSVVAIVVGQLYWQVDRTQFRTGLKALLAAALAAPVFVLGVVGSAWCFSHHVCMAGHMHHPPYPPWHYGLDAGWVLCLGLAVLCTRLLRASLCIALAVLASFLISYRFLFGSLGGMYEWLPL